MNTIGIRREEKNIWERRVPITPDEVARLVGSGITVRVQPSERRIFPGEEYARAGAEVSEDLSKCSVILGVKEIPESVFEREKAYLFFSHTVKGQSHNMPMLRRMMQQGIDLIDYEKIVDDEGRRLVLFGRFAGLAGMIDSLHAYGRRLQAEGFETPLDSIRPSHEYSSLEEAKRAISAVGEKVQRSGWPREPGPVVCGFAGYGNVSEGAQEIFRLLGPREVEPQALSSRLDHPFVQVVFREEQMVRPVDDSEKFNLQEYYDEPDNYRSRFEEFLPALSLLINAIYWDERYPRLVTNDYLGRAWRAGNRRLRLIGDISCDIEGAVECTVKATDPGNPVYVYEPGTGKVRDGVEGEGPVILAVDNLPCELPREASCAFSESLAPFLPALARADFAKPLDRIRLPGPIRRALILHKGELTEEYRYMASFL